MDIIDTNTGATINKRSRFRRFFSKFWLGFKKVGKVIVGRTMPQKLFRLYLIIVITGALFLCAPFCLRRVYIEGVGYVQANGFTNATGHAGGINYTFIQALFIACSGFSDTGLTPIPIYLWLNAGGQVVLAILIEIGGIGVVALFYYIWNSFKKKDDKIDVGQLFIMQAERGGPKVKDSYRVIKTALIFILLSQVVFMFMFALCFCFIPAYVQTGEAISYNDPEMRLVGWVNDEIGGAPLYLNFGKSLWTGFFTTISAMNNAGFDNISANSMAPYRNDWGVILQFLIVLELIIGGLGHFAAFDIIEKIRCKKQHIPYKVTLYTKVALTVYAIVAVFGIAGGLVFEFTNPVQYMGEGLRETCIVGNTNTNGEFGNHPIFNKIMCVIFHSFNCRSLGMESVRTHFIAEGSKWTYAILMFIGASPCSTAGGIRTTTLAVIFVTIWCKLCGRKNVFFFRRRINDETVLQSFMIFVIALVLLLIGAGVVWSSVPHNDILQYSFSDVFVECCSAFGTVGLSTGISSLAKWWGLLYLVILMFVGQLGIINSLLSWTKFRPRFNDIQYQYEDIKIG